MILSDNDRELILHQLLYTIPKDYWGTIRLIVWFLHAFTTGDKSAIHSIRLVNFISKMEDDDNAKD